jgi:ankyrin repeat protein
MHSRRYVFLALSVGLALAVAASLRADGDDLRVLEAVKHRDQKAFDLLIRAKADINAAEPDGATALAWAVHLGERKMAEVLLRAGANVNAADGYGETPLTLASANGDGALVPLLLAAGAKADATRWNGETALMLAAGAGTLDGVKALLGRGANVNAAEPRLGQTALMWAAAEGQSSVIGSLVEAGAKVNAVSVGRFTPLMFAAVKGDAPSVKALLAAGADPNYTLSSGNTPLMVALSYQRTSAAMALLEGGALVTAREERTGNTPLHLAAQSGDLTIVNALLARKVDPNIRTARSSAVGGARGGGGGGRGGAAGEQTPLVLAAINDREEVMRALVAAGADPSLRGQDGRSLLMLAVGGARIKTVKYAYELDPHVDVVADGKTTMMHAAVALGGRTQPEVVEIVQFLADHGAALDELDATGRTPIARADSLPVDLAVNLLTKLITEGGGEPKIRSKFSRVK